MFVFSSNHNYRTRVQSYEKKTIYANFSAIIVRLRRKSSNCTYAGITYATIGSLVNGRKLHLLCMLSGRRTECMARVMQSVMPESDSGATNKVAAVTECIARLGVPFA